MKKLIGLCCLGLLSTASVAQNKSLQDCRAIGDVNARVACYDEIVDARQDSKAAPVISSAPALIPQASVATDSALAEPGNTPTIERDTQLSLFGAEAELTRTVIAEELGVTQLDQIEALVEQVSSTAYKQLILRLDNGHIWQQTDSKRLSVREGEQIIVRSGRLGAFFLEKSGGSRAVRVKRVL